MDNGVVSRGEREALHRRLKTGPMYETWHWLAFNFAPEPGGETPFASITLDALPRCDAVMPGYADAMLTTLESIGGRDRDMDDYESIRQWLGELVVVRHFVTWPWPTTVTFEYEPTAPGFATKPEITITAPCWRLGIEVKTPDLRQLAGNRTRNDWQMLARVPGGREGMPGSITLPRDNPVKDFLVSADRKFAGFRKQDKTFRSVLVIVWDDFINEPLSALKSPASGLLTSKTFHVDDNGRPHKYPNVDVVVLLRQQHQLKEGMANRPPIDERYSFLDYGGLKRFPPNAVVVNPNGQPLNEAMVQSLQAYPPDISMGAEYEPAELVIWV